MEPTERNFLEAELRRLSVLGLVLRYRDSKHNTGGRPVTILQRK